MNGSDIPGRLLVALASLAIITGCTSGASPSPPPASMPADGPTTADAMPSPSATPAVAPTQTAPVVLVTRDIPYQSSDPILVPGELDVYAPAKAGAWPVVVLFHGAPGSHPRADRGYLGAHASRIADLGFVVFNASWGHVPGVSADAPDRAELLAVQSQAACAVEFARTHATEYGGDPSTMIVFGHSGGAHAAAMAAFARPKPTTGCPGGAMLGPIDTLVTWEGNWLLSVNYPDWDAALAADSTVMDAVTPWSYLADHKDQKVVMLVSESPGTFFDREVGDPWAADSWLAVRDPSGDLRRQLEANGAFTDGTLDFIEVQELLYSVLETQGSPVTLDVMPDSIHETLAGEGWDVFLAAFVKAAAGD